MAHFFTVARLLRRSFVVGWKLVDAQDGAQLSDSHYIDSFFPVAVLSQNSAKTPVPNPSNRVRAWRCRAGTGIMAALH
jgi:hypothetical protein